MIADLLLFCFTSNKNDHKSDKQNHENSWNHLMIKTNSYIWLMMKTKIIYSCKFVPETCELIYFKNSLNKQSELLYALLRNNLELKHLWVFRITVLIFQEFFMFIFNGFGSAHHCWIAVQSVFNFLPFHSIFATSASGINTNDTNQN